MKDRDGQKKEKRQSFSRHASISPSASVLYSPLRHVPTFVSSAPLPDIFRVIFFLSRRRRGFVGHWWGSARFHWVSPDFNKKDFCYRLTFVSFFFFGGGGGGAGRVFFSTSRRRRSALFVGRRMRPVRCDTERSGVACGPSIAAAEAANQGRDYVATPSLAPHQPETSITIWAKLKRIRLWPRRPHNTLLSRDHSSPIFRILYRLKCSTRKWIDFQGFSSRISEALLFFLPISRFKTFDKLLVNFCLINWNHFLCLSSLLKV